MAVERAPESIEASMVAAPAFVAFVIELEVFMAAVIEATAPTMAAEAATSAVMTSGSERTNEGEGDDEGEECFHKIIVT